MNAAEETLESWTGALHPEEREVRIPRAQMREIMRSRHVKELMALVRQQRFEDRWCVIGEKRRKQIGRHGTELAFASATVDELRLDQYGLPCFGDENGGLWDDVPRRNLPISMRPEPSEDPDRPEWLDLEDIDPEIHADWRYVKLTTRTEAEIDEDDEAAALDADEEDEFQPFDEDAWQAEFDAEQAWFEEHPHLDTNGRGYEEQVEFDAELDRWLRWLRMEQYCNGDPARQPRLKGRERRWWRLGQRSLVRDMQNLLA